MNNKQKYLVFMKNAFSSEMKKVDYDAAKSILQEIYIGIPFIQMKKIDYDWYVEAPE